MLALAGFLMILATIYLLLKGKSSPIVVMTIVPVIAALLVGTSLPELGEYVSLGIEAVASNAVLFIFSIIFFSVMQDLGVFDILVNWLIKVAGDNIVAITIATSIIGIIAHIDGATATTVLITVPAMYPVFKKLEMRTEVLLCIVASAMGVMNLLPWGGPVARSASVLGIDATDLWITLIPVQLFGVAVIIGLAAFLGFKEKNRLASEGKLPLSKINQTGNFAPGPELATEQAGIDSGYTYTDTEETTTETFTATGGTTATEGSGIASVNNDDSADNDMKEKHKKLLPFNALWTVFVIGVLVWNQLPSYLVFMLGLGVTLMINFPSLKEQHELFKKHAGSALLISATMLAAGVMVGIMTGTGMVEEMAAVLTQIIPAAIGQFTHVIFGVLALPMGIMIGTDAYFFGFMPPILEVGEQFGISSINTAMTMLIGKNLSLMISPLVPATFLALGLVEDTDLKSHMRFSAKYLWIASLLMLLFAFAVGIIHF